MEELKASFDARLLNLIAPFVARNDVRFYLQGIHVSKHPNRPGVLLAATDGHQLALAYDPTGTTAESYILRLSPQMIVALRSRQAGWVTFEGGRLIVREREGGSEVFVQAGTAQIYGEFPDYVRLLPKDPAKLKVESRPWIAARLQERAAHVGVALTRGRNGGGYSGMAFLSMPDQEVGAVYARYSLEPNILVITMPMREKQDPTWPDWLKQ